MRGRCFKLFKMSGVSREAPCGIQFFQKLSGWLCPRLQINRLRCISVCKVRVLIPGIFEATNVHLKSSNAVTVLIGQFCLRYQASVLILTYFTYMTYHLTRKPISVVKSVLHQNCSALTPPPDVLPGDDQWCNWAPFNTSDANTLLGALDSAFLFSYAGAMFVSGMVAERVDLRYFLSIGMLVSSIFCYLFGLGKTLGIHHISFYLLAQAGAGIAQTTGWPGTVAIVGKWFGNSKKGLIFGLWNSHTSLGNILGTVMASEYVERDWALSFVWPALVMGAMAFLVFLFLAPEPRALGLHPGEASPSRQSRRSIEEDEPSQVIVGDQAASLRPNRHSANSTVPDEATEETSLLSRHHGPVSLSRALGIPGVLEFSLSLLFAKLVSYTFLYWLPMYINTTMRLTPKQSGELSTAFDVGGVAGAAAAGLLADWLGAPALVCAAFYAACAPTLLVYQQWGSVSYELNAVLLVVAGLLVNAPYALITTAVSAELGMHSSLAGDAQALATVTAIIDGTGSIGAAIGPMLAGVVSSWGSWSYVFYMLITCDFLALVLLIRIAKSEYTKLRRERRMTTERVVRIE